MTVYLQKDRQAFTYEFQYKGRTYKGTTGQLTEKDAKEFERREKERVRKAAAGLLDIRDAPSFAEWAGVYYTYKSESRFKLKRPEQLDVQVKVALRFFGRRPEDPEDVDETAPYHDLTLADPVLDPQWLVRFEEWMEKKNYSGSHRNHLRTQISGMYKVAALPEYRNLTGVTPQINPMMGVPRDRRQRRDVTLTPDQVAAWIGQASYHVRLALAIAALAPKLRLSNVLELEWKTHVDEALVRIMIVNHKTEHHSNRPIVQMISAQLRDILKDAKKRNTGRYVIAYRGHRVRWIREGVKRAAERAKIPYGRSIPGGATFHTIRHAVATWLAEMEDVTESMRASLLAHSDIRTTQGYTHLRPLRELKPLEQLSQQLPIAKLVKTSWRQWSQKRENKRLALEKVRTKMQKAKTTATGAPARSSAKTLKKKRAR